VVAVAAGVIGLGFAPTAQASSGQQPIPATAAPATIHVGGTTGGGLTARPQIIGGSTTTISSAPFMAQLWYYVGDGDWLFCGGSVVAPTKILTAGHCVSGLSWTSAKGYVVTGATSIATPTKDGDLQLNGGTISRVKRTWVRGTFAESDSKTKPPADNDIALLTLTAPVTAKPIKITTSGDTSSYTTGNKATVYGWGLTSSTGEAPSAKLKEATLPIDKDSACQSAYGKTVFVSGHMVCAGKAATGSDATSTTTCSGDSGGPLVEGGKIVGLVSWGADPCSDKGAYSVFTKVSTYVGYVRPRIDDTDWTQDGKADLLAAQASTGEAYAFPSTGSGFGAAADVRNLDWANVALQADLDRNGTQDLVVRSKATGNVYWYHAATASAALTQTKLFSGWTTRKFIVAPGDVTGDGLPDLLSVDSAGKLWVYPGKGNGTFSSRWEVSSGWGQYNSLRAHGDLTGDGKVDLLARKSGSDYLYLVKGTYEAGSKAFGTPIHVRTWTGYNAFDAVGDVTGDGHADFVARTPGGTLYLYPGTGKATSSIFGDRIKIGTGWTAYNLYG
jgi:hypothetical protein